MEPIESAQQADRSEKDDRKRYDHVDNELGISFDYSGESDFDSSDDEHDDSRTHRRKSISSSIDQAATVTAETTTAQLEGPSDDQRSPSESDSRTVENNAGDGDNHKDDAQDELVCRDSFGFADCSSAFVVHS